MTFSPDPHPLARHNSGPVSGCLLALAALGALLLFLWCVSGNGSANDSGTDAVPDQCWCVNPSMPGCATRPGGPCENCPRNDYSLGSCPGDLTTDQERWPTR